MTQTISICIIAKNEENCIEDCLKSILPIADEIILVDTGSTDKTLAIAKKYSKTYSIEWNNDFSQARNESLKHASCDWILIIDADEILAKESQKQILNFLKKNNFQNEPIVFNFKILEETDIKDKYKTYYKRALFKNGLGIKFSRPIHEELYIENVELKRINSPMFCIYHKNKNLTKLEKDNKIKNYIQIMLKELEKNITDKDKTDYYKHLGNAYEDLDDRKKALEYYLISHKYYNIAYSSKNDLFYTNLLLKITKLFILNRDDYKNALTYAKELFEITSNSVDGYFYIGYCEKHLGNFESAILNYEKALSILSNKKTLSNFEKMKSNLDYEIQECKLGKVGDHKKSGG